MQKSPALISVCIPAYNCGLYITQTLQSLCNQSHSNLEIIVVNDGSEDDTLAKLQLFNDSRIKIIDTKNSGAAAARNLAFSHATGSYIVFFDSDDLIDQHFLRTQVNAILNDDKAVAVSGWGRFYKADLSDFKEEFTSPATTNFKEWILTYWTACNPMTAPGRVMMHRSIVEKAKPWNESLTLNDDLEFYSRIFLLAEKITINPEAKLYYRSGINGLSGIKGKSAFYSLYKSVSLAVDGALQAFPGQPAIAKACANMLQNCIYEFYPQEKKLIILIERKVKNLGGATIKPHAGGITLMFYKLLGWKLTMRLKYLLNG